MEPRKFIEPPDHKVRQFPWSTGGGRYKGVTFASGLRVKMRLRKMSAVLNGKIVKPEIPGAEPYLLIALMPTSKPYSKGAGRRFILSNGDNYYDIKKISDDGIWENQPWSKRPWIIKHKSGRRKLTTLHQNVINQIVSAFWQENHIIHEKGTEQRARSLNS